MLAGRAASAVLRRSLARSAGAASSAGSVASVPVAATSALPPSSVTSISSASRSFSTAIEESLSARDAWQKSCYVQIDYSINEDLTVYDAIQRFAAYDIGCLVTVDSEGAFRHVVWELRRMGVPRRSMFVADRRMWWISYVFAGEAHEQIRAVHGNVHRICGVGCIGVLGR